MIKTEKLSESTTFPDRFSQKAVGVSDFDGVLVAVSETLQEIREETGILNVGFVSGKIRAEHPQVEFENRRYIQEQTERIRTTTNGVIIFNLGDIFGMRNDLYKRLTNGLSTEERGKALCDLCVKIVETEVTELFLLPGYENSEGAKLEQESIQNKEGTVIFLPDKHDLILPR